MQVKNISARGWWVMGVMVAPGETKTVEATAADIGDNPDLVIVAEEVEEPEQPEPAVEPEQPEAAQTAQAQEPEKRKPGRPAK